MAFADFESLCRSFCELAGLPLRGTLAPDDDGTWSATIHLRGVEVTALQMADRSPDTVFLIAQLGTLPEDRALPGWLALLNANLQLAGRDAPGFCRSPSTGDALMHCPCPLSSVSPADVYRRVSSLVDAALLWRDAQFLGDLHVPLAWEEPNGPAPGQAGENGGERFLALHGEVCRLLDQRVEQDAALEGPCAFPMHVNGVDVSVVHDERGRLAWCVLPLGRAGDTPRLDDITDLMDANFALMSEPHAARFSRDPLTGELLLQCAHPLESVGAQALLESTYRLVDVVRDRQDLVAAAAQGGA